MGIIKDELNKGGFTMYQSQKEANKRYAAKNKERIKYLSNRSRTRNFLKKEAVKEDLKEMLEIINSRMEEKI